MGNNDETIALTKDDFTLSFDHKIRAKTGYVGTVEIFPVGVDEVAVPMLLSDKSVDINELDCLIVHVSEDKARAVAKYYGIKVIGKFNTCSACAEAKARQSNFPKG